MLSVLNRLGLDYAPTLRPSANTPKPHKQGSTFTFVYKVEIMLQYADAKLHKKRQLCSSTTKLHQRKTFFVIVRDKLVQNSLRGCFKLVFFKRHYILMLFNIKSLFIVKATWYVTRNRRERRTMVNCLRCRRRRRRGLMQIGGFVLLKYLSENISSKLCSLQKNPRP